MLILPKVIQNNKRLILIIFIILICSIAISYGIYAQITNKSIIQINKEDTNANYKDLKNNFQDIFTNTINIEDTSKLDINYEELVYCRFDIDEQESGKYTIKAKIPGFKGESETIKKINKEILETFGKEAIKISKFSVINTTYNINYVAYVNNNIVSLVIMCEYKNGTNAQRKIVQTYNYDIENDKVLNIDDIIKYKSLDKNEMQQKINEEIKMINEPIKNINSEGYNIYLRDENSDIYKIDNTNNFFLGKNNYLYIVYAYGNDDYTNLIDLVIF